MVLLIHSSFFIPSTSIAVESNVIQGVASIFRSLANIIGLTVGGFLYHFIEAATFLISAAVIFTVFIMSFRVWRIKKEGDW